MTKPCIHITGGAGCGITTLGRALADQFDILQFDTDDYYWVLTDPPYWEKQTIPERLRILQADVQGLDGWVLSGALESWGDPLVFLFDLVIFMQASTEIRLQRLREREALRYGAENVAPGGRLHEQSEGFIEWASHYDDGTREGRSRSRHETWLRTMPCPVLRLDGTRQVRELVAQTVEALA